MADELFPTFSFPGEEDEGEETEEKYYPSVSFDFSTGDFFMDGRNNMVQASGREAYIQWCVKMASTERFACLAYSDDQGVELEGLSGSMGWEEIESEIERTITEAIEANPATEYVGDFEFDHKGSDCTVSFTVKGKEWTEESLSIHVNVR